MSKQEWLNEQIKSQRAHGFREIETDGIHIWAERGDILYRWTIDYYQWKLDQDRREVIK